MPSDPDNRMDELLKSYAKKRQEEAGAPAEMHPATRRLLQAEIAKLRPEPSAPSVPWWQNLVAVWPRLAFAAGMFVVLGVATWSLMDSMKQGAAEPQLAKHDPTLEEKAVTFADDRESLRNETVGAEKPVRLAKEADARSRTEAPAEITRGFVGGRGDDALSKQKEKVAELSKAEGAVTADRFPRSPAPIAPPPASTRPVMLAEQESRQLAAANAPTQQSGPTKPGLAGEFQAKDASKANIGSATGTSEALGKNLAANEEVRLGLASASTPINARDVNLTYSANNQPGSAVAANAVTANAYGVDTGKLDNNSRLPGGVLPPTDSPARQALGNTTSSLDSFYAANQNNAAGGPQTPKLQLSPNDNSGQAFANNRETLLRQNYDQRAANATDRPIAPVAQPMPAERKPADVALAGAKVASDKAVREKIETAPTRADSDSYANRGVVSDQSTQKAASYRQRFAQVPSGGQSAAFKKIAPTDTKVLANFEVQRSGGLVRVVDSDGSVYDGQVVAGEDVVAGVQTVTTDEVRQQGRRSVITQPRTPAIQQAATSEADGQNWAFRVSGTNRTLRQPVSLEGVMQTGPLQNQASQSQVAESNAKAPQQLGQSTRRAGQVTGPSVAYKEQAASQLAATGTNLFGAQRIQGRLRIGPANQVQLEAVPADN